MPSSIKTLRRMVALSIALAGATGAAPAALAGATLATADGSDAVSEASHRIEVTFAGVIATVETEQTLVASGKAAAEAIYTFELPGDAAITAVEVMLGSGASASARVVDVDNAIAFMPESESTKGAADLAVLRMIGLDADAAALGNDTVTTYELRIYPVEADRPVRVTTRWVAPLHYQDGRLLLRIPGRGDSAALVREGVSVAVKAPDGATGIASVSVSGRRVDARKKSRGAAAGTNGERIHFTAALHGDIVVDAVPIFAARDRTPRATFAAVSLGDGFGAVAATVLVPPTGARDGELGHERVIVVVDVSRSMDAAGLRAAADLTDALLARTAEGARVEVVTFDRTARRVLGAWSKVDAAARKKVATAIESAPLANGSDLGAALDEVRALATAAASDEPAEGFSRGDGAAMLVVVISDNLTPLELDGDRAVDRIGAVASKNAQVLSVVLVPDDAAVPSIADGALPALARATGGRAMAVRHGEVAARAATLVGELAQPAPFEMLTIDDASVTLRQAIPTTIAPGSGATLLGFWRGKSAPKTLTLSGRRGADEVAIKATRAKAMTSAAGPLVLASAALADLAASDDTAAERALVAAATKAPTVTRASALVALDPRDDFAADRWALFARWGTFARMPPPSERASGGDGGDGGDGGLVAFRERPAAAVVVQGASVGGALDPAIIGRVITTDVLVKTKRCYEIALRKDAKLAGSLTMVMEISRGEVQAAHVDTSTFRAGGTLESCVVDAAYAAGMPRVSANGGDESVWVIRYPLRFQMDSRDVTPIIPGDADSETPIDFEMPLDGIETPAW